MTYDRTKAKKNPGEHCRFCGESSVPLVKTRCCEQWICCDTSFISIRGGGYCQFEHEHYSMCHFHYNERHKGQWQECEECKIFWKESYGEYPPGLRNEPEY
jgi:hypothetical protein